jgi:hypothetical protein
MSSLKRNRPDLGQFVVGHLYVDSFSGELVEFVGLAAGPEELHGEDVAVFRFPETEGGCRIATLRNWKRGQRFTPL